MVERVLPTEENNEIDKLAMIVKEGKWRGKMIGFVGTNRWSKEGIGMEVGYCLNIDFWGEGYCTEGFKGFLEWFWGLEGRCSCCFFSPPLFLLFLSCKNVGEME